MIEERIKQLGFTLPDAPAPLAAYIPCIREGNLVFTAGQLPIVDGKLQYSGKVGAEITTETGMKAAELCLLNCLSVIKSLIENLDNVEKIIKLTVFVNSADYYTAQPKVANGASELLVNIFSEAGKHVRSAVGVSELPLNAPVEIEMIAKVK